MTDFVGYKQEFLRLFGFEIPGVDYEADVDPDVKISNPRFCPGSVFAVAAWPECRGAATR